MEIEGVLEIDRSRGVIYFHSKEGRTVLRICNLPAPIPKDAIKEGLDITHMFNCSWSGESKFDFKNKK